MLFLSGPSHDKGSPKVKQMGPPGPLWKISNQSLAGEENPKEVRLAKKEKKPKELSWSANEGLAHSRKSSSD